MRASYSSGARARGAAARDAVAVRDAQYARSTARSNVRARARAVSQRGCAGVSQFRIAQMHGTRARVRARARDDGAMTTR